LLPSVLVELCAGYLPTYEHNDDDLSAMCKHQMIGQRPYRAESDAILQARYTSLNMRTVYERQALYPGHRADPGLPEIEQEEKDQTEGVYDEYGTWIPPRGARRPPPPGNTSPPPPPPPIKANMPVVVPSPNDGLVYVGGSVWDPKIPPVVTRTGRVWQPPMVNRVAPDVSLTIEYSGAEIPMAPPLTPTAATATAATSSIDDTVSPINRFLHPDGVVPDGNVHGIVGVGLGLLSSLTAINNDQKEANNNSSNDNERLDEKKGSTPPPRVHADDALCNNTDASNIVITIDQASSSSPSPSAASSASSSTNVTRSSESSSMPQSILLESASILRVVSPSSPSSIDDRNGHDSSLPSPNGAVDSTVGLLANGNNIAVVDDVVVSSSSIPGTEASKDLSNQHQPVTQASASTTDNDAKSEEVISFHFEES
jgi:hypothetical protein